MARMKLTPAIRTVELPTFEGPSITDRAPVDPPQAVGYHIYVRPRPPKQNVGMIALAKRSIKAQLAVCSVAQIVEVGFHAFKASTPDMDPKQDPVAQSLKVGDWIHFRQHAGQKLKTGDDVFGTQDASIDEFLLTLSDSDVLGRFRDKAHADSYYDWL